MFIERAAVIKRQTLYGEMYRKYDFNRIGLPPIYSPLSRHYRKSIEVLKEPDFLALGPIAANGAIW